MVQSILSAYIKRPTFRYVFWLRIVRRFKQNSITKYTIGAISWLFLRHYEFKYGIHINSNIHIGKGLYVVHGDGVYLNVTEIGDNFTVYQEVTLGASPNKGIPTVGNNVTVYMGAKVFGDIELKNGCVVAANAVVTHTVEEGEVVAGVPARRLK